MQFNRRAMSGPALTALTALLAVLAGDHDLKGGAHLAPLLVCIVAFAGSLSGLAIGCDQLQRSPGSDVGAALSGSIVTGPGSSTQPT